MDKAFCKDLLYAGITELMENRRYYYTSTVGVNYSHWTEEGKQAVNELLELMTPKIQQAQHNELDRRAKDMVLSGLTSKS